MLSEGSEGHAEGVGNLDVLCPSAVLLDGVAGLHDLDARHAQCLGVGLELQSRAEVPGSILPSPALCVE